MSWIIREERWAYYLCIEKGHVIVYLYDCTPDDDAQGWHCITFTRTDTTHWIQGDRFSEWFRGHGNKSKLIKMAKQLVIDEFAGFIVAVSQVLKRLPVDLERHVWSF
jgi:hypothetical protein